MSKGELTERVAVLETDQRNIANQVNALRREFRSARNAGFWLLVTLVLSFGGTALALMFNGG